MEGKNLQEENIGALVAAAKKDPSAKKKLAEAYLPKVKALVEKADIKNIYAAMKISEDRQDIVQDGAVALVEGIEKFFGDDSQKGKNFKEYIDREIEIAVKKNIRTRMKILGREISIKKIKPDAEILSYEIEIKEE